MNLDELLFVGGRGNFEDGEEGFLRDASRVRARIRKQNRGAGSAPARPERVVELVEIFLPCGPWHRMRTNTCNTELAHYPMGRHSCFIVVRTLAQLAKELGNVSSFSCDGDGPVRTGRLAVRHIFCAGRLHLAVKPYTEDSCGGMSLKPEM